MGVSIGGLPRFGVLQKTDGGMTMQKWEYFGTLKKPEEFMDKGTEEKWLNKLGQEGWELVNREFLAIIGVRDYLFKRPMEE